ncbi:patatin-like phospholipase family protein [Clostridium aminobutyricum]|uniref:Patatin-like phospholipase family protein n=1 Tax=Clostridium aminobutyricum TaxID=33953 RepID=A0A939IJC7_CLOAM|nr:patatin-like phospholipase family protein [Clostridium aminobutyricum]MBN7773473.1 patatin-like phospholipase family protein [Clostridium aminobutyricum]
MNNQYQNFVFSGGGILGIAYIGMLDYLYNINLMQNIKRVAGSSAGAITACITSFNLPFEETKKIADSLNYSKVPSTTDQEEPQIFSKSGKEILDKVFINAECVYRLITQYGWYSSNYMYNWIKLQIADQFDGTKKAPPYTFIDFMDPSLHKEGRNFKDLYIIGTDVSTKSSSVFCAEYTPYMEVAEAVRISMSVPLFFQAIKSTCAVDHQKNRPKVYADGGILYNYPITLFDIDKPSPETLGALFNSSCPPLEIDNLLDFIVNLLSCTTSMQTQYIYSAPENLERSIQIYTSNIASLNFNVKVDDDIYTFLYKQGYLAAENYFNYL